MSSSEVRRSGLQTREEFGSHERSLKRKRDEELAQLTSHASSRHTETVYRDKLGRKIDAHTEQKNAQELENRRKAQIDQAQFEWGRGSAQKREEGQLREEYARVVAEPFARMADDPYLEKVKKAVIHEGDPMANYFRQKEEKSRKESGGSSKNKPAKKLYAGPNPTPNRFGLRPGYRWDAIDRSNGFEAKVLKKRNEKQVFNEEAYKYAVADL